MQPILSTDDTEAMTQSNGNVQDMDEMNGTNLKHTKHEDKEKVVLPVEMACMVPLRALIGKLVHKSHADLMTLTDT